MGVLSPAPPPDARAVERVRQSTRISAASSVALRSRSGGSLRAAGFTLPGPGYAWSALWLNVMAFLGTSLIPIPGAVGQLITQGALPLALFLALMANPRGIVRPNLVLILITLMALAAFLASLYNEFFFGSLYRGVRLMGFVTVLWLLTRWWGVPEMPLLKAHLKVLRVVVGTIIAGAVVYWPGAHNDEGRLIGTLWPVPAPQVGHYGAMLFGLTAVLWFTGKVSRRTMLITFVASIYCLLDSHTRTALAGMLVGLVIAGASLFIGHARVRRTAAVTVILVGFVGALFAPYILLWLSRGQTAEDATQLTGRTKVWSMVVNQDRPWLNQVFGNGLSNKSFNGLPIDSNWVATYYDQGIFGAALIVTFLLTLVMMALTRPQGPRRAIALFILTYCIVASFTETGLGDASPYLLDITVACSALASRPRTAMT